MSATATIAVPTDQALSEALSKAKAISWDGCHKIYILIDASDVAEQKALGYGDSSDQSELIDILPFEGSTAEAFGTVKRWYETSCELKFISTIDHGVFAHVIDQFEGWIEAATAATPQDIYQEVLAAGGTYEDLVVALAGRPMTQVETAYVLWELTPFPLVEGPAIADYIVKALQKESDRV